MHVHLDVDLKITLSKKPRNFGRDGHAMHNMAVQQGAPSL